MSRAHRRKFDASGQEVEPNFSQTTKVSTGFLNSSYSKIKLRTCEDQQLTDFIKYGQLSEKYLGCSEGYIRGSLSVSLSFTQTGTIPVLVFYLLYWGGVGMMEKKY